MSISRSFLFVIVVLAGCGKNDPPPAPVFTDPNGNWTYTTPDQAIKVEFELVATGSSIGIANAAITVSGTPGVTAGQMTDVDLPTIGMIRINANDAALTYPYSITFNECTISTNFNSIDAAGVEYTYPWGTVKSLSDVSIQRKP